MQTQGSKKNSVDNYRSYRSEGTNTSCAYDNLSCSCDLNQTSYSAFSKSSPLPSFYDPKAVNLSSGYGQDSVLIISSGGNPDKWQLLSDVISCGGVILKNGGYLVSTMAVAFALDKAAC